MIINQLSIQNQSFARTGREITQSPDFYFSRTDNKTNYCLKPLNLPAKRLVELLQPAVCKVRTGSKFRSPAADFLPKQGTRSGKSKGFFITLQGG